MSRTFQDSGFLVWEAYSSSGKFGASEHPHIVFHCLTDTERRPRWIESSGDEADAERRVEQASSEELIQLLGQSQEIQ